MIAYRYCRYNLKSSKMGTAIFPPQCLLPLLVPLPLQLRLPQLHLVYKQSFKHLHNHQQPHPSTYYRLDSHPINFVIAVRPVLEPFRRAACWFTLGIDPFTKLGDVLFTGVSEKIVPSTLGDLDEVNALRVYVCVCRAG